jgi:hypothetical protein
MFYQLKISRNLLINKEKLECMQTNNLKYTLLDKLISIRDLAILQKVSDLLSNVDINKPTFKVTGGQKQMLMSSEEDVRIGNLTSDEELNAEEDLWLNGKRVFLHKH